MDRPPPRSPDLAATFPDTHQKTVFDFHPAHEDRLIPITEGKASTTKKSILHQVILLDSRRKSVLAEMYRLGLLTGDARDEALRNG
jgi:hypothetical protein